MRDLPFDLPFVEIDGRDPPIGRLAKRQPSNRQSTTAATLGGLRIRRSAASYRSSSTRSGSAATGEASAGQDVPRDVSHVRESSWRWDESHRPDRSRRIYVRH